MVPVWSKRTDSESAERDDNYVETWIPMISTAYDHSRGIIQPQRSTSINNKNKFWHFIKFSAWESVLNATNFENEFEFEQEPLPFTTRQNSGEHGGGSDRWLPRLSRWMSLLGRNRSWFRSWQVCRIPRICRKEKTEIDRVHWRHGHGKSRDNVAILTIFSLFLFLYF